VTYVYNTDANWYSCNGGWKTFVAIDLGASIAAAGILLTPELIGVAAGAEGVLGAEGALGSWEWATHLGPFLAPGLGLAFTGGTLVWKAVTNSDN
jgi:hypothetical protein